MVLSQAAPTSISTQGRFTDFGVNSTSRFLRTLNLLAEPIGDVVAAVNISIVPKGHSADGFQFVTKDRSNPLIRCRMTHKHLILSFFSRHDSPGPEGGGCQLLKPRSIQEDDNDAPSITHPVPGRNRSRNPRRPAGRARHRACRSRACTSGPAAATPTAGGSFLPRRPAGSACAAARPAR